MPLNNTVYEQILEQFGFDADYTVKCIEANRHNNITAAYHLMYKKAQRQNKPYVMSTRHVTGSVDVVGQVKEANVQKRGTSTGYNYRNGNNQLQSVNGGEAKSDLKAVDDTEEVNEQKKYKLEMQAEIQKLRKKYANKDANGNDQITKPQ